jgi:DNA primase catalytic core
MRFGLDGGLLGGGEMARIAEQEIERLKKDISLERLVEAKGIELKRHGSNLMGLCPFHDDRTPSLVITPDKNLWHCLGACQAGGSVIDWVMRAEGVSFRCAVEMLRGNPPSFAASSSSKSGRAAPVRSTTVKLPPVVEASADDQVLLRQVVDYYHATIKESPEALSYLESRGLRSAEMVDTFRIGFANRTLAYRLPQKNRKAGGELRGGLQRLGVLRESGHEHFNGSIVVPILDESGRVTEMYGRKITPGLRPGTPQHLYLPGPHRGVFNAGALGASPEIVLCESLIDALTFWCAGVRNVTSSYGVEGFTDDHRSAFRAHGVETVKIAYDRDEAGDRAAEKLSEELNAMGIDTYRVLFPKGMDANEYAQKVQPAAKSLDVALRHAQWMGKGRRTVVAMPEGEIAIVAEPASEGTDVPLAPELTQEEPAIAPVSERRESASASEEPMTSEPAIAEEPITNDAPAAASEPEPVTAPPANHPSLAAPSPCSSAGPTVTSSSSSDDVTMCIGPRRWRVRGLGKNLSPGQLRVNVMVSGDDGLFFVDTLELYSARQRAAYTKQAAQDLGVDEAVVRGDLGHVLSELERRQDAQIQETLAPKAPAFAMGEAEHEEALDLLRDPRLLERVARDIGRCGVVGEETNKLVGYLAATSRKLEAPLAVVIQSTSAAGKTSLMDGVLSLMPPEELVQYSAMTGQSLFYMGEQDLKHKILGIVEEQGAERASYALKLLQSEGELTIASTGKDPATGKLVTQTYRVEGPVMIFLTTTAIEVDEELLNRCLVLTVDEGREQTRAIHAEQRLGQTLPGLLAKQEREGIRRVHRNAQRLLRPLLVVNPFAEELTFADHATRTRRDHMKYLTLIRAVALLHQHQRSVQRVEHAGKTVEYIEVARADIEVATRLAHAVLGRSLDELPPQTRRLLELLDAMVTERAVAKATARGNVHFTRREVREHTRWGATQVQLHLRRLEELEYVVVHRGGRGATMEYELVYAGEGAGGERFALGLGHAYDANLSGSDAELSGPSRPQVGPEPVGSRGPRDERIEPKPSPVRERYVNGASPSHLGEPRALAVVAQ